MFANEGTSQSRRRGMDLLHNPQNVTTNKLKPSNSTKCNPCQYISSPSHNSFWVPKISHPFKLLRDTWGHTPFGKFNRHGLSSCIYLFLPLTLIFSRKLVSHTLATRLLFKCPIRERFALSRRASQQMPSPADIQSDSQKEKYIVRHTSYTHTLPHILTQIVL